MNLLHFAFGLGALIAPLIVARCFLIDDSIRRPYWILAGLLVPISAWMLFLKSPPVQRRESKAHTNSNPANTIILVTLLLATSVGVEAGFAGWIAKYALAMNLAANSSAAAVLTSGFWMAFVVGRLVGIPIAIRVRPSKVLAMDLVGCALGPLVILLWPRSANALWVGAMIAGFSVASMFAMTFALTAQRLTVTSRVTSYLFVGVCTGGATIPWIIGQLFERVGPQAMLYVILADVMVGVVIFALLLRCSPGDRDSG
jgi:fucose permease